MSDEKEVKLPSSTDGKVMVDRDQLDFLIKKVKDLEQKVDGNGMKIAREVKEKTARMRKVDGKIVVGFEGKNWTVYNEKERKEEMFVKLILENGKKKEMNYLKFINESERIEVKIVEQKISEDIKETGVVEVKKVDGYSTVGTDVYVPMAVVTPVIICKIKNEDGELIEVDSSALNI
jgi:hypothetical protein